MIIAGRIGSEFVILLADQRILIKWPKNDLEGRTVRTIMVRSNVDYIHDWDNAKMFNGDFNSAYPKAKQYLVSLVMTAHKPDGRLLET